MTLLSSIQNKIENKIFNRLGSTIIRSPYVSASTDKWGDESETYDSNENVTAVPYNYLSTKEDYQPFGDLQDGESVMAFKHDQTLSEYDKITFDSKTFIVKEIEKFPLANGYVLKIARLAEEL